MTNATITNNNIDNFKTYEGYKNMYIIESYYRHKNIDTVIYSSKNIDEILDHMDNNELWEDCYIYNIDKKGNATYPEF